MRGMIIIQFNDFAYLAEGEHYMNEKQYLRANKRVFLAATIKKLCDGLDITLAEFFSSALFDELEQEIH